MIDRKDWLLLLLGAAVDGHEAPEAMDRARVMKSLFVLARTYPDVVGDEFYRFRAYNYGPFDTQVYRDAEALEAHGLLRADHSRYVRYAATAAGRERASELCNEVPDKALAYLMRVRDWANAVDFNTLVKAVYQKWPEMRANSIFVD